MPKIYEYLGYIFFWYSNDHLPKHLHVKRGGVEMKVEIQDYRGTDVVRFIDIGSGRFSGSEEREVTQFVNIYRLRILKKWEICFIENKKAKFERVNTLKKPGILKRFFGK